jgi:hypothetical protein
MRQIGFDDADITTAGADRGVDVVSSRAVAQVKHYATSPVGAPAVQQLRGAAHAYEWHLFYSLSGYTKAAVQFADDASVALFTYDARATVSAANIHAEYLLQLTGSENGAQADAFDAEEEARRLAQEYFDLAFARYMRAAEALIGKAKLSRDRSSILRILRKEQAHVSPILETINASVVPLPALTHYCDQIIASAERVERAL